MRGESQPQSYRPTGYARDQMALRAAVPTATREAVHCWYALLERARAQLPEFSRAEQLLLTVALQDKPLDPDLVPSLWAVVAEAKRVQSLDMVYGVDWAKLMIKLRTLDLIQAAALWDTSRRVPVARRKRDQLTDDELLAHVWGNRGKQ